MQTLAQVFAGVAVSPREVYVGQPLRVTVTVYTHTWFTAPVEFGNLQVPGAFIVPFDDTQPGMFTSGGKQYPGIQFYYIVFPYKAGSFSVPSLEITATSPPEGSSTGRKVVIHTTEQAFTVRDVPDKLKAMGPWFVAKSVRVTEHWDRSLNGLKVGDVLKRTVTVEARGTLPQFIPDITPQERVDWASTYPQAAVLTDSREGGDVSGRSVTVTSYLLEKAGTFDLPALTLPYWNPLAARIATSSLPDHKIEVAENSNLGILTTLRDSLAATAPVTVKPAVEKGPLKILGMRWYVFAGVLAGGGAAGWLLWRLGRAVYRSAVRTVRRRRAGEPYLFKRFLSSGDTPAKALPALYRWWDAIVRPHDPSIGVSLHEADETGAEKEMKAYLADAYANGRGSASKIKEILKRLRSAKRLAPPMHPPVDAGQTPFEFRKLQK